ncbi:hypothetical protein PR202_gb00877 [Eleusine coracana subsp. coracana]|uniref:Uncharacterized protein n=1 Tax=Eleusine coracana subsp. coracana TaxID=191504 RepID=A0AAV5DVZ5_ELECO|nr:hypothetical protein PR202_gb00877 [Eleusine coracana subsp. coracana]
MGSRPPSVSFKLVLLGDGPVGKTSLVLRYVNNVFSDKQEATVQASYLTKRLVVEAALLVYDITDSDTFNRVTKWIKELQQMASKDIVIAIAANKSDLVRLRSIDTQDAISYAESIGANYFVTSAKAGTGIDGVFNDIAKRMTTEKRKSSAGGLLPSHQKNGVLIVDDEPEKEPPPKCCS